MDISFEQLVMVGGVCAVVFMAGYQSLALAVFLLMFVFTVFEGVVSRGAQAAPQGVTRTEGIEVRGAEVLEPIVIKTTRGPPYRIPDRMDIRMNPYWRGREWYTKAAMAPAILGRSTYKMFRGQDFYG
jgi:hypothetical protein